MENIGRRILGLTGSIQVLGISRSGFRQSVNASYNHSKCFSRFSSKVTNHVRVEASVKYLYVSFKMFKWVH